MSNNMPYERKGEKVKPGIYRVYNGSPVEVIMMVPEPETGKEFVICKKWRFVRNRFGSADVEDKLCHDVCTFLLICCGSKNPVKLNLIYD